MKLNLHNSLSDKKEEFIPISQDKIGMYVCGPTVYDFPHIGNARAVVVYDVLYRILLLQFDKEKFSEIITGKKFSDKVIYVRNITDVDDKINKAAIENKESIHNLTARITKFFQEDMAELNNLEPNFQPKVTENIPEIISTIERILNNKNAYISEGHILLDVKSIKSDETYHYGTLSGKVIEQNIAGARVGVEGYKRSPEDFVLWKPADKDDDISSVFESPWGQGRPGWHIECTAMSNKILGADFDIHGGGADLKFPHHENEIAQNKCANPHSHYAKYWVHNGFVTVNGEKMSKSLGNFTTVRDLILRNIKGEVIRFALLSTHYRKPLDFNEKLLQDSEKALNKFYKFKQENNIFLNDLRKNYASFISSNSDNLEFFKPFFDDMNLPIIIAQIHNLTKRKDLTEYDLYCFAIACDLLGICQKKSDEWFVNSKNQPSKIDEDYINTKIAERIIAKKNKNFQLADAIRDELKNNGITLKDKPDGTSEWFS